MTDLSPQAQAVLDAAFPAYDDETVYIATGEQHAGKIAAASLRVVSNDWRVDTEFIGGVEYIRTSTLDAIANELEGK